MTLHDYWLMCPRGQLIKKDWSVFLDHRSRVSRCEESDSVHCSRCMCPPFGSIMRSKLNRMMSHPHSLVQALSALTSPIVTGKRERVRNMFGPVKATLQGVTYLSEEDMKKREHAVKKLIDDVSLFISPSEFLRDMFVNWGMPEDKIIHIENGTRVVPFNNYSGKGKLTERKDSIEVLKNITVGGKPITFGFVGSIRSHKGVHVILKAAEILYRQNVGNEFRVVIHGKIDENPSYSQYLKKKARGRDITFSGPFPESRKPEIYREMDVLVVPSLWFENSPVTIHEAFAAGVPVIASRSGGMKELVEHGMNGLLYPMGDAEGLAESMKKIIRAKGILEKFRSSIPPVKSMEEHCREILDIYGRILKK